MDRAATRRGWDSLPTELKQNSLEYLTDSTDKKRFLDAVNVDPSFDHPMVPENLILIAKQLRNLKRSDPRRFEQLKMNVFRKTHPDLDIDPSFAHRHPQSWAAKHHLWDQKHSAKIKPFLMAGAVPLPSDIDFHIIHNHPNIVKVFIDEHRHLLDRPVNNFKGRLPIHVASRHGHTDIVKYLNDKGSSIDAVATKTRRTPLHDAVKHRHLDTAKFLLAKGADVNAKDKTNVTPLMLAFTNAEMVQLLLQAGADPNALSDLGSVVHHAVNTPFVSWDAIKLLLATGINVNDTRGNGFGNTPLHEIAMYNPISDEDESLHLEVAIGLLLNGANRRALNDTGATPLDLARENNYFPSIYKLLKRH